MQNRYYQQYGYYHVKGLYNDKSLSKVRPILDKFHNNWLQENQHFYKTKSINSSGLTAARCLTDDEKLILFKFINSDTLLNHVRPIIAAPCFMNTQLFFNPYKKEQRNYWHRDMQYHLNLTEQKEALKGPEVLHCRVAFEDELGIEVIPASHKHWDSKEELTVRLEEQGASNSNALKNGKTIALKKGDLLIFSANMIHRGLYGLNRFAFDILYFDRHPSIEQFLQTDFLPTENQKLQLDNPDAFIWPQKNG
tara:strand:- start:1176 stop:1928 length:753 start_codon:yes stop_codon:yes gene_type:complete